MLTTLALVAALSAAPGQASALTLTNVRNTYGFLGPERADAKLLPGDTYLVQFDIEGITIDAGGKALYSLGMEVTNSQGKIQYKQDPNNLEALNTLGGRSLPAFAHVDIGLDQPPGEYTLKVTVVDRASKANQMLTRKFEVLPKGFGIVRPQFTLGQVPVPPIGVEGQEYVINFAALGFQRDPAKKQPHVSVEMRVLDEAGKPTLPMPFTGEVNNDVPEKSPAIPMQFVLKLNRTGRYTIELKANDQIGKKTVTLALPLTVTELKPSVK